VVDEKSGILLGSNCVAEGSAKNGFFETLGAVDDGW
jgi:hypothetical protein